MANEITKLDGDGGLHANLLFLYPLTPITYTGSSGTVTVVPTPSVDLPLIASNILGAAEIAALDNGSAAFEVVTMVVDDAKTNAQLLADAQALYAKRMADYIERLTRKYNRVGQRFNGV